MFISSLCPAAYLYALRNLIPLTCGACLAAPAAKSTTRAPVAQVPAKSIRQLNKENEDLQIKVEDLTNSLQAASAGKQAVKAAFEVRESLSAAPCDAGVSQRLSFLWKHCTCSFKYSIGLEHTHLCTWVPMNSIVRGDFQLTCLPLAAAEIL